VALVFCPDVRAFALDGNAKIPGGFSIKSVIRRANEQIGKGPGNDRADLAWRTKREIADRYASYLYEEGIRPLEEKALGVQLFREDRETESEFVAISYWESVEAMSRFTGGDPNRIHHLDRDAEFLIELPERVQILTILNASGNRGGET
jgi:hypothetical protein